MELNEEFRVEYENALKSYILDNQEIALNRAYELGRKSLQSGHSILDTARLNSELIFKILSETDNNNDKEQIVSSATMFFTEYLSPFVMTFKGFMDVVENLKREVSVRMQTEDTYRQSVNYYEALLRNALDIITILDKQGNMIFYNASVTRILGYSEDELLNKNVFEFIHPDDIDGVLELFNKAITIPSYTATTEFRFRHKKGDWVILESVGKNMLTDPDISGVIVNSRDVTDRRNLEEIRRKYEFIANASLELTGLINREYKYEAVNDAYCLALSRERSEIIGKSISEIFGRETFINSIKDKIDRAFKGSEIIYETWFTLPVLGKIYMELAYYPYKNKSNNVTHVVFRNRDITERKKREDEIKNSQIQLAEAQQIAHIGSWEWSTNSNTIWCSDELCRILGLDPDQKQISYKQFLSYVDIQDRKKLNIKMMNALNTSTPFIMEHKTLIKDGISKILQTRGKVVFDENKLSSKLIGTSQDVTEQVFTQQAIKSSEIKYRRLFETSKEGIILLDASTGVISDINPFVTDLLGFPKENYVGKKLWETKAVKGIPDSENAFRELTKKSYTRFEELDLNTKNNKKVKIEFISIAYTVNSDKLIQCHLWDVTERKILQEKLNRSAKQRAEDLKKFAHSIQHAQEEERLRISRELHDDVCQRLTALKFQLNIFEDKMQNSKQVGITKIRQVKKEIDDLIVEVRGISSNLRPTALDHFGLVTALRLLCSESKKIHPVKINFKSNIQTFRHFDPNIEIALYRIGQEALSNCMKYSKAKEINLKLSENESKILLKVADNGLGFDINKYYNQSDSQNGHYGLINMRERAEQLHGLFNIKSAKGKGTSVEVTIPITKNKQ